MKQIIKFTVVAFAALLTNPLWAEWKRFSSFENDSTVTYIDQDSVKVDGEIVRFWQLYDLKSADNRGRKSYRVMVEIDCKGSKIRNLQDEYFSGNMTNGIPMGSNTTSNEWKFIAPGTLPSMLFKANCKNS